MRPRHKAAEYHPHPRILAPRIGLASMRPRHKAAEYTGRASKNVGRGIASMRPRHKAAEYDLAIHHYTAPEGWLQ